MNISLEFTAATPSDDGKIILRTQSAEDIAMLRKVLPPDQSRNFSAQWDGNRLVFGPVVAKPAKGDADGDGIPDLDEEKVRVLALSDAEMQTLAAEQGVKWDPKASRDTMAGRIAKKTLPPAPPK
jgi:hypothetical protein